MNEKRLIHRSEQIKNALGQPGNFKSLDQLTGELDLEGVQVASVLDRMYGQGEVAKKFAVNNLAAIVTSKAVTVPELGYSGTLDRLVSIISVGNPDAELDISYALVDPEHNYGSFLSAVPR